MILQIFVAIGTHVCPYVSGQAPDPLDMGGKTQNYAVSEHMHMLLLFLILKILVNDSGRRTKMDEWIREDTYDTQSHADK
jgi:hypothetical protein